MTGLGASAKGRADVEALDAFCCGALALLGGERVLLGDALRPHERSVEGLSGRFIAAVLPRTAAEVQALVALASGVGVTLYPVSRGRNWGYGTRLAPRPGAVLMSLERMDRIRSIDPVNGTATIEPGVTQRQLAEALRASGAPFYTDVTGSGADTSVVGNTLERGVAYSSLRADNLRSLEVVLGDGRLLRTGLEELGSRVAGLYRHGVGPGLTELFLQSNFGVVTAMRVALRPIPEDRLNFQITLADPSQLPDFIQALAALKRSLGFSNILHIGNRQRAMSTLAPLVRQLAREAGLTLSRARVTRLLEGRLASEWSGVGLIEGPPELVRAQRRLLARRMAAFGEVRFYRYERVERYARWAARLGRAETAAGLRGVLAIMGYTRGIPSDAALHSVYWPLEDDAPDWRSPEAGRAGWILVTPLMPACDGSVREAMATIGRLTGEHEVLWSATLNLISDQVLEAVVSLTFPLDDPAAVAGARACSRALNQRFTELGMTPYRVPIDQYDTLHGHEGSFWDVAGQIKDALDPGGVIAPGRWLPERSAP